MTAAQREEYLPTKIRIPTAQFERTPMTRKQPLIQLTRRNLP